MKRKWSFCGNQSLTSANHLGGVFYYNEKAVDYTTEVVVIMGGFARAATDEKLLRAIAEKAGKPCFIFDWHGVGMSTGNFGDVTVERLATDLKRVVGMLFAEGFSKFHFVGHSLGACVIALFGEKYASLFDIGKKIYIAPAFDQSFLLRYWFTQGRDFYFSIPFWRDRYENSCSLFSETRIKRECNFSACWNHEREFQEYIHLRKNIKGIDIDAVYWEMENPMNYLYYLTGYDGMTSTVSDENALFIFGDDDKVIPIESIIFDATFKTILYADHYFAGEEDNVAKMVNSFLRK